MNADDDDADDDAHDVCHAHVDDGLSSHDHDPYLILHLESPCQPFVSGDSLQNDTPSCQWILGTVVTLYERICSGVGGYVVKQQKKKI